MDYEDDIDQLIVLYDEIDNKPSVKNKKKKRNMFNTLVLMIVIIFILIGAFIVGKDLFGRHENYDRPNGKAQFVKVINELKNV